MKAIEGHKRIDPRLGEWADIGIISGGAKYKFNAPDEDDRVLYMSSKQNDK
ncbi:MAG: hypothetical protein ACPL7B_10560 [Candidatus Poribacteria bacterium]